MDSIKRLLNKLFCRHERRLNPRAFVGEDRRKSKPSRKEMQQMLNKEFDEFATIVTHGRNLENDQ